MILSIRRMLAEVRDAADSTLENSDVMVQTYRTRCKDGSYLWVETTTKVIRYPKTGKILEIVAVTRDVSERKEAQEALEQANAALQASQTTYYLFENGHELPLLCFCCARPLVTLDLAETRHDMQGRRLDSMSVGTVYNESGEELLQFRLEFSDKGWLSKGVFVPVAPEVAVNMRHPPGCPYGKPAQKKASSRNKRKRRKR